MNKNLQNIKHLYDIYLKRPCVEITKNINYFHTIENNYILNGEWHGSATNVIKADKNNEFDLNFNLEMISRFRFKGYGKTIFTDSNPQEKVDILVSGNIRCGSLIINYYSIPGKYSDDYHGSCVLTFDQDETNTISGKLLGHRSSLGAKTVMAKMSLTKQK